MIIRDAHEFTLHGGPQDSLTALRQTYWIVSGRSAMSKLIAKCVTCIRDLPDHRVNMAPLFAGTGTDYAGPFKVRLTKTRGRGTLKCYIALFICLVT